MIAILPIGLRLAKRLRDDLEEPLRMVSMYLAMLEARYGSELDTQARMYMPFAKDGSQKEGADR